MHMIEDLREMSLTENKSPKEIIHEMYLYMIEGGAKFPEITRLVFYDAFINNNIDGDMNKVFSDLLSGFADHISDKYDIARKDLTMALHRLFSTLFFVSIFPGYFQGFTGYNLKNDKEIREEFIDSMVNSLPF